MKEIKKSILFITPVKHIKGFLEIFSKLNINLIHCPNPSSYDELPKDKSIVAIFTNPNKSNIFIDEKILKIYPNLKVITTASTGTVHINKEVFEKRKIPIISLTNERQVISKISSTAEHAFCLALAAVRNAFPAYQSTLNGEWDYEPFIGRQFRDLTVGVIGYGRLGTYFSNYSDTFGAKVLVYDPYKDVSHPRIEQVNSLDELAIKSDIVSLHVHVNDETREMISESFLRQCKKDVKIINTSRGEIVCEKDLIKFLSSNNYSFYATDVIANEQLYKKKSPIIEAAKILKNQILITPHIGGMTVEAQLSAFTHAAKLLKDYLKSNDI